MAASFEPPAVGEVLTTLSPAAQLRRKLRWTKITGTVETITYLILIPLMFNRYVLDHHETTAVFLTRRITAYFHGMISVAYGVMVLDIYRAMGWSKKFLLLSLAGPPGAVIAIARLTRQPFPDNVRKDQMLF